MKVFTSREELQQAAGTLLGSSKWLTIEQDRVNQFADATGDHQWIHVDEQRAATGPFGGTIAAPFASRHLGDLGARIIRSSGWARRSASSLAGQTQGRLGQDVALYF